MPARCLPYLAYIAYNPTTYRQFGIFVLGAESVFAEYARICNPACLGAQRSQAKRTTPSPHGSQRSLQSPGTRSGAMSPSCSSRKAIFAEIDASLTRLGMDHVDLYQIHRWDYDTPIEETLEALHASSRLARRATSAPRRCMLGSSPARSASQRSTAGHASSVCRTSSTCSTAKRSARCCRCVRLKASASPVEPAGARQAQPRLGLHQHPDRNRRGLWPAVRQHGGMPLLLPRTRSLLLGHDVSQEADLRNPIRPSSIFW